MLNDSFHDQNVPDFFQQLENNNNYDCLYNQENIYEINKNKNIDGKNSELNSNTTSSAIGTEISLDNTLKKDKEQYYDQNDNDYEQRQKTTMKRGYCEDNDLIANNAGTKRARCKSVVTDKEMNQFFQLLEDDIIQEFLHRDRCCLISDKVIFFFFIANL